VTHATTSTAAVVPVHYNHLSAAAAAAAAAVDAMVAFLPAFALLEFLGANVAGASMFATATLSCTCVFIILFLRGSL
jgi:hypothetical protein